MYSLLKPSEVAHQLGVSRAWVYDAAKCGRIPSVRIGGEDGPLRFVPEDLERWLEHARVGGRPSVKSRRVSPVTGTEKRRRGGGTPRPSAAPQSLR